MPPSGLKRHLDMQEFTLIVKFHDRQFDIRAKDIESTTIYRGRGDNGTDDVNFLNEILVKISKAFPNHPFSLCIRNETDIVSDNACSASPADGFTSGPSVVGFGASVFRHESIPLSGQPRATTKKAATKTMRPARTAQPKVGAPKVPGPARKTAKTSTSKKGTSTKASAKTRSQPKGTAEKTVSKKAVPIRANAKHSTAKKSAPKKDGSKTRNRPKRATKPD